MGIARIDPIQDHRWHALMERHPDVCIFHTPGWLEALRRTYGFEPVAYTTARTGQELENGLVMCNVDSWLTGKRSVSLPFSDHCHPLVDSAGALEELLSAIHADRHRAQRKFVEIRPLALPLSTLNNVPYLGTHKSFYLHTLDLSRSVADIFSSFSKSERNAVRRAERENLVYQAGRSRSQLSGFYHLYVLTRRRHGVPPQPIKWFSNLIDCLGGQVTIRIAFKDSTPVAATLTLTFKRRIIYKYGCSDRKFNSLGAMPFLCWKAIQEAKYQGATEFDLGRSDLHHDGLIDFKDRLGANRSTLVYYRDTGPR